MKKGIALLLCLLLAAATLVGCAGNNGGTDHLARIKKAGKITIATEGDWAPWTYHDESGTLVGFDIEVGMLIAQKLGVKAEFVEAQWDSILAGVDSGRFDIACNGVGYTPERAEKYTFTDPYVYTHKVLIVREDNEDIRSFEDLSGKKTANTISSTYAAIAQENGAEVVPVDSLAETIELLIAGRVDATINSQVSFNDYKAAHPDAPIKIVAQTSGDAVVIPLQKSDDSQTLCAAINEALKELRDSGELAAISEKYFKADNTKPED